MMTAIRMLFAITAALLLSFTAATAQDTPDSVAPAPDRPADEGEGPFERLIIRGATLIDGSGAPPIGPVDIVIENNRIAAVEVVGAPGTPIDPENRPGEATREVDAHGMYVMPGFVNAHAHISNPSQFDFGEAAPAEYAYKLWLSHGVTTIREVGSGNGRDWTLNEARRSAENAITAPRIIVHDRFQGINSPDEARQWVRDLAEAGADGIKFGGAPPEIMKAALDEAQAQGLETAMHHAQMSVARWNVLDSARAGLTSMEHWYGLPEAMFDDRTVQDYPVDYNYMNEQHRFGQAGRLWKQAAEAGSEKWNAVMDELLELDFTIVPTLTIYEATRDVEAARNRDFLKEHTWPALARFFEPSRTAHGSFWHDWTTADEIAWKENFRIWMDFLDEYKNRGGRIAMGDDAGFIYRLYGFGYIREFEMLQEAGFHPLEVVRAATLNGAELIGHSEDLGTVQVGKLADLVITPENPLQNFKTLYGNGAVRLNDETGRAERVGGIRWVIKDGILFDAPALLQDVRDMVDAQAAEEAQAE